MPITTALNPQTFNIQPSTFNLDKKMLFLEKTHLNFFNMVFDKKVIFDSHLYSLLEYTVGEYVIPSLSIKVPDNEGVAAFKSVFVTGDLYHKLEKYKAKDNAVRFIFEFHSSTNFLNIMKVLKTLEYNPNTPIFKNVILFDNTLIFGTIVSLINAFRGLLKTKFELQVFKRNDIEGALQWLATPTKIKL